MLKCSFCSLIRMKIWMWDVCFWQDFEIFLAWFWNQREKLLKYVDVYTLRTGTSIVDFTQLLFSHIWVFQLILIVLLIPLALSKKWAITSLLFIFYLNNYSINQGILLNTPFYEYLAKNQLIFCKFNGEHPPNKN